MDETHRAYLAYSLALDLAFRQAGHRRPGVVPLKVGISRTPTNRMMAHNRRSQRKAPLAGFCDWDLLESWPFADEDVARKVEGKVLRFFERRCGRVWREPLKPAGWRHSEAVTEIVWVRHDLDDEASKWDVGFPGPTRMIRFALAYAGRRALQVSIA